jgi:RNA polymerase sigma-70 factor (ECF subfamily)
LIGGDQGVDGPGQSPSSRRSPYGGIPGESELVARAKRGDAAALDELCSAHWRGVFSLIVASVRNPSDAEELTQEVFERAIRSLPQFEYTGAPFSAYLTQITKNLLRDRWRSSVRRESIRASIPPDPDFVNSEPESAVLAGAEREVLARALQTLAPEQRRILYFRIVEGLSAGEVAAREGKRPDAIRQLQRRALSALRVAMAKVDPQ